MMDKSQELERAKRDLEGKVREAHEAAVERWLHFSLPEFSAISVTDELRERYRRSQLALGGGFECPAHEAFICRVLALGDELRADWPLLRYSGVTYQGPVRGRLFKILEEPAKEALQAAREELRRRMGHWADSVYGQVEALDGSNTLRRTYLAAEQVALEHDLIHGRDPYSHGGLPGRFRRPEAAYAFLKVLHIDAGRIGELLYDDGGEGRAEKKAISEAIAVLAGDELRGLERLKLVQRKLKSLDWELLLSPISCSSSGF